MADFRGDPTENGLICDSTVASSYVMEQNPGSFRMQMM